jgi:hypothetical protein
MQISLAAKFRQEMKAADWFWEDVVAGRDEERDEDGEKMMRMTSSRDKVMRLREYILAIYITMILETYGVPKGMDKNAKEKYRICMVGAGIMSQTLLRHWTEEAWDHLMQFGTFKQWIK